MGIGASVFLIAVGAILAFGVNVSVGWLDLWVVGWVLMAAGLFGLIFTLWLWQSRRREVVTTRAPVVGRTVEERREVGTRDIY